MSLELKSPLLASMEAQLPQFLNLGQGLLESHPTEMAGPLLDVEVENGTAGCRLGVRIHALTLQSRVYLILTDPGSLFTQQECHYTVLRDFSGLSES